MIGTPTLVLALLQLTRDVAGRRKPEAESSHAEIEFKVVVRRTIGIILWTLGCFFAIWLLGFSYAVPLTILLYLKFAGRESWTMTALVTFFAWLFFWALFEKSLNVPFPEGLLFTLIRGGE